MTGSRSFRRKTVSLMAIILFSCLFLMGDFCEDVLSIPLKVDYTGDPVEMSVNFAEKAAPDGDTDMDIPEGDVEIPDGDTEYDGEIAEIDFEDGFDIGINHRTVNFEDSVAGISKYKKNLVGIFIRNVTYKIISNNIPADLPPLEIYLSKKIQSVAGVADGDEDADSELSSGGRTFDFEGAIASGEVAEWELNETGVNDIEVPRGAVDLVKLGETDPYYWKLAHESGFNFGGYYPSDEIVLERTVANVDDISDVITENFAFEVVIRPKERIYVMEADKPYIPGNYIGQLKLELRFVVVVIAKA